jgi:hypothetical protein
MFEKLNYEKIDILREISESCIPTVPQQAKRE